LLEKSRLFWPLGSPEFHLPIKATVPDTNFPSRTVASQSRRVIMAPKNWQNSVSRLLLRLSLAVIFAWFGTSKLFNLCPLGEFIARTLPFLPARPFLIFLGCWEVMIGTCLLAPRLMRVGLVLMLLHLPGTALPMLVIPGECFREVPFALTLEGQYIVKNLVLASAALVLLTGQRKPVVQRLQRPRRHPLQAAKLPEACRGRPVPQRAIPVGRPVAVMRRKAAGSRGLAQADSH
jgi:uncharacterized membrane protein YphA (DoxX/SURF4 family)